MKRSTLNTRKVIATSIAVPFDTVEEAWFWFIRCQKMRHDGVKYQPSTPTLSRPCEPADIYCTAKKPHRMKRITDEHLDVLTKFGLLECPPDPRHWPEQRAAIVWDDALEQMLHPLRTKGIVVTPEYASQIVDNIHAKQ